MVLDERFCNNCNFNTKNAFSSSVVLMLICMDSGAYSIARLVWELPSETEDGWIIWKWQGHMAYQKIDAWAVWQENILWEGKYNSLVWSGRHRMWYGISFTLLVIDALALAIRISVNLFVLISWDSCRLDFSSTSL